MKKKTALLVALAFLFFGKANVLGAAYLYQQDFEGERTHLSGYQAKLAEEEGNHFMRIAGACELPFYRPAEGNVVISFDMRMPTLGDGGIIAVKSGSLVPVWVGWDSEGRISLNGESTEQFILAEQWVNLNISVDTYLSRCRLKADGAPVGGSKAFAVRAGQITSIRIAPTSMKPFDLDNVTVADGIAATVGGIENDQPSEGFYPDPDQPVKLPERNPVFIDRVRAFALEGDIRIDGKLDESDWQGGKHELKKSALGEPAATTYFAVRWNSKGVYVACWAFDNALRAFAPDTPWLQDGFEIYFDGGNEKAFQYDNNDRQYSIGLDTGKIYNAGLAQANMAEGVLFAQNKTEFGWTLELFVPFEAFGAKATAASTVFGFDVGYNDSNGDTAKRDGQLMWNGYANNSIDASRFGEIILDQVTTHEAMNEAEVLFEQAVIFKEGNSPVFANGMRMATDTTDPLATVAESDGLAYVPIRILSEALNAAVLQNGDEITMTADGRTIKLVAGSTELSLDGESHMIPAPPYMSEGKLFLPIRSIAEVMGKHVYWAEGGYIILSEEELSDTNILALIQIYQQFN